MKIGKNKLTSFSLLGSIFDTLDEALDRKARILSGDVCLTASRHLILDTRYNGLLRFGRCRGYSRRWRDAAFLRI